MIFCKTILNPICRCKSKIFLSPLKYKKCQLIIFSVQAQAEEMWNKARGLIKVVLMCKHLMTSQGLLALPLVHKQLMF